MPAGVIAELVIANRAVTDTNQYGTGLLGFGAVHMYGAEKTPTWTRLATEPRAGDTTLTLAQPVSGWRAGDRLILPDSRHLHWNEVTGWARTSPQWEELTLSAISADGRVLTVSAALRFSHPGARDGATGNGTLRFLPHVGNLTRNVVVRSESPIASGGTQGHALFMERADVDIRYAAFRDLGRTPIRTTTGNGRYPIYFEDLIGPATTPANGYQHTFVGNAVDGGSSAHSRRWAISLDDSHYGLIADNVLYNYAGALVMTEAGSESYNVFERNFLMRSTGTGGRLGMGDEGQGFWFRGSNNYVRGNVTANFDSDEPEAAHGYMLLHADARHDPHPHGERAGLVRLRRRRRQQPADSRVQRQRGLRRRAGAHLLVAEQPGSVRRGRSERERLSRPADLARLQRRRVSLSRVARPLREPDDTRPGSVDDGVLRPRLPRRGLLGEGSPDRQLGHRGDALRHPLVGRGNRTAGRREQHAAAIRPTCRSRRCYSANGPGWLPARTIVANNVNFLGATTIGMSWDVSSQSNTTQRDTVLVYGYKGVASDNFQVYYNQQSSQSVAGGLAPCANHRPEISGIVCGTAASSGPAITWLSPFQGSTGGVRRRRFPARIS